MYLKYGYNNFTYILYLILGICLNILQNKHFFLFYNCKINC